MLADNVLAALTQLDEVPGRAGHTPVILGNGMVRLFRVIHAASGVLHLPRAIPPGWIWKKAWRIRRSVTVLTPPIRGWCSRVL